MNIVIVLGSIRNGRRSGAVADWIADKVKLLGHKPVVADFKQLPLPLFDSEIEPAKYNKQYPYQQVQDWSGVADSADAFVFVVPEYNHGMPAVLKNALDWLYSEFAVKPAGLVGVSSGKVSGARAVEHMRELCGNFGMYDIKETLMIGPVQEIFSGSGSAAEVHYGQSADRMLAGLVRVAEAMKPLREK